MRETTEITANAGQKNDPVVVWPDPSPLSTWWKRVMGLETERSDDTRQHELAPVEHRLAG
ncbi:hypothetical protein [Nocardia noduli]|uniref:hypothetical protein n=1 Tax=Nocardia noduli TaxID=2815722 RepID=UPI001C216FD6|nr:hypothetical protein [Nocardia noduli]